MEHGFSTLHHAMPLVLNQNQILYTSPGIPPGGLPGDLRPEIRPEKPAPEKNKFRPEKITGFTGLPQGECLVIPCQTGNKQAYPLVITQVQRSESLRELPALCFGPFRHSPGGSPGATPAYSRFDKTSPSMTGSAAPCRRSPRRSPGDPQAAAAPRDHQAMCRR